MSAIDPASWRRLLVVKMFAMGDVLNATPVFRALRRALPGCRIELVVGKWSAPAVAGNTNIDEAVVFDDAELRSRGIGGIWRFVRRLRGRRYDAAIILHRAVRVNALIGACGVPVRAGIGWNGRGLFLTRQAYEGPETTGHEIRRYLNVLSVLGIPDAGEEMEFFVTAADSLSAERILEENGAERPVVLCPGGASNPGEEMPTRRWPVSHYAELARRLLAEGESVVILGGAGDAPIARRIAGMEGRVLDLTGRLRLGESAGVMKMAAAVVTHDSGPLHLAAAVGAPLIALFGPTDPRIKFPPGERSRLVYRGEPCSPCYDRGRFPACSHQRCLALVTPDHVMEEISMVASRTAAVSGKTA